MNTSNYSVIDLFCGVGGLAHGFVQEGFNVVAGVDSDESCQRAFEKNNHAEFISKKIEEIHSDELLAKYPENSIKILIGCAPCQPFSRYNSQKKATEKIAKEENPKWQLLEYFANFIEEIQPDVVSMENVPQLANLDKYKVYQRFISVLLKNGYYISDPQKIVHCPNYGIPQNRRRLVLLASKYGEISLIPPTHTKENFLTVKEAIGKLPPIKDGETSPYNPLHRSQKLSVTNKKRIRIIKEGESWRNMPEDLVNECHKKLEGKTFGDVYGRMWWDQPSPTLTTHCIGFGNGRFGHPEQDRAISLLEAAILQTFPEDYFVGTETNSAKLQRQIGNAVPVRLGQIIAQSIKEHLKKWGK